MAGQLEDTFAPIQRHPEVLVRGPEDMVVSWWSLSQGVMVAGKYVTTLRFGDWLIELTGEGRMAYKWQAISRFAPSSFGYTRDEVYRRPLLCSITNQAYLC